MAHVDIDIRAGNMGRYGPDGWENVTRIATVSGLTGSKDAMLLAALEAATMPAIGDAHPSYDEVYLDYMTPESVGTGVVTIRLDYSQRLEADTPQAAKVQVGASLSSASTNVDYYGNPLLVAYDHDDGKGEKVQTGTVEKLIPEITITATRIESSSPGLKAMQYVGKINSGVWSLDTAAEKASWLCTGIVGVTNDNGESWEVTYTFAYREIIWTGDEVELNATGWFTQVAYDDPKTGRPPGDVLDYSGTAAQGVMTYREYGIINFNGLNL